MALVLKFAAMVSPNRAHDKKLIDGGDFYNMAATNFKAIKMRKVKNLAELVYKGGSKDNHVLLENIRAGRGITF